MNEKDVKLHSKATLEMGEKDGKLHSEWVRKM
jgi:hypothetical protein